MEDTPAADSILPPATLPIPANIDDFHPKIAGPIREALRELRRNRESAAAWRNLAHIYDAQHYYSLAERCYQRTVELDAANARSWYNLAFVRGKLADVDGACAAMSRAITLDADYSPAHWRIGLWKLDLGDLDAAEASFEKAAALSADDSVSQICLARVNLRRQDWDRAVELLEPIARTEQRNARYARQLLAPAYRALGRREDATAASLGGIGRALDFDDPWRKEVDQARAYLWASLREANRLLADGRRKEAIALLDELRDQKPKEVGLVTEMARSYRNAGRFEESAAILTDVLAQHPNHYPAELALARTLVGMQGKANEALAHADRAIELNSTLAAAHALRGQMLRRLGNQADAGAAFREASRCEPASVQYLYAAALTDIELERWEAAAATLQIVTKRSPNQARVFQQLALAYLNLNRLQDAELAIAKAQAMAPTDPQVQAVLRRLNAKKAEP